MGRGWGCWGLPKGQCPQSWAGGLETGPGWAILPAVWKVLPAAQVLNL